jgi:O-antigen biosynthesis protein
VTLAQDSWTRELRDPGSAPDVSIIICAHGQSDVTLLCLKALNEAQFANAARAEVIVVDDASPDETRERVRAVRGVRLVELDTNVGFLLAANAGLSIARGRHVLFLNNDTEPIGNWLDPLLDTLERRPGALVVGSRLVYPDGSLQEAGGIIFDDASGWNYGRGGDAFDPRVTYAREVDYVSGAALLVDGDFLRARGGFDVRFAPAYYEDTDLCFAARAQGGEVWYQPASIVVHYEGKSHGTDESSGVKAYQVTNRAKFQRRWAEALVHQWPNDPANVPAARQRCLRGSRILVIDNGVPAPDEDSGSVRLTQALAVMLDAGFAVSFLAVNGWRRQPYVRRLERMGVEVLGVPDQWWAHVESMRGSISHVWICRPDVATATLDRIRESLPAASLIYDTVDLHFLRMEREAETVGGAHARVEAMLQKRVELDIIERSDAVIVVSEVEAALLRTMVETPVFVVPNIHESDPTAVTPAGRSGLLFVGGFQHRPNEDAVQWFVEQILPLVVERHPDTVLTVVGSNVPDSIRALAGDHVRIAGWVDDLVPLYRSARVGLAPLRYGAGIKGKVGEAMSLGLPMAMTTIAAEGMHITDRVEGMVADDPAAMADAICALIVDDELWARVSAAGRVLIDQRFGVSAARASIIATLQAAGTAVPALEPNR